MTAPRVLPHTHGCFVCGESNPAGLKVRFEAEGNVVTARFIPRVEHAGFKQVVHGGISATLLDEAMVWACAVQTRCFAYCAELNVRYAAPLRPGESVVLTAEMTANRRHRIFEAKGEIRSEAGLLLASSTGKYLPIKESEAAKMLDDFVGPNDFLRPV